MLRSSVSALLISGLGFGLGAGACATAPQPAPAPAAAAKPAPVAAVRAVKSEEEYVIWKNELDALVGDEPQRREIFGGLLQFQLGRIRRALELGRDEDAIEALRGALTLLQPRELVREKLPSELVALAGKIELRFSRRGAIEETVLAQAVQATAGDAQALARYKAMDQWLKEGEGRERLAEALETTARIFPAPFVLERLIGLYADLGPVATLPKRRLRATSNPSELRGLLQAARMSHAISAARLYLRIGQLEQAGKQLRSFGKPSGDEEELLKLVDAAVAPTAQPRDFIALASYVAQQSENDRDLPLRVCLEGERRFPKSSELKLCTGERAFAEERIVLAMRRFEEVIAQSPAKLEVWQPLARVYQARLYLLSSDENVDVPALERELAKVEKFFTAAKSQFGEKPMVGALGGVLYEVGRGYYNAGRGDDAARMLERSIGVQPTPPALELLGTLHLKRGQSKQALAVLERVANEPPLEALERLYWRARSRRLFADAQEQSGDRTAEATRKSAVADWDVLLANNLKSEFVVEALTEKGKLLYQLGDRRASLDSFAKAIDVMPDRGGTYAELIAFFVPRGELEQALDAYHRALGREEVNDYLKVYCSLWILDLLRRADQPPDPLALSYLNAADGTRWFDDLARWVTGRQTEAALAERANTPGRRVELAFYRAMQKNAAGQLEDAKRLWQEVVRSEMMGFFEFDMASLYLKLGEAPRRPLLSDAAPSESSPTSATTAPAAQTKAAKHPAPVRSSKPTKSKSSSKPR